MHYGSKQLKKKKKVLEMLVGCSLKKFSSIYTVGVPEDEIMWDNMNN